MKNEVYKKGDKVIKKSGKPFKSGKIVNTIEDVVINEQDPKKSVAYKFYEDNSVVNAHICKLYKLDKDYSDYDEIEFGLGWDIQRSYNELRKYCTDNSHKVYGKFNDHFIDSDMTIDDAYIEITGRTKQRYDYEQEKRIKKAEESNKHYKEVEMPKLKQQYIKKAEKLLNEEGMKVFMRDVDKLLNNMYRDIIIDCSLELIALLKIGASNEEVKDKMYDQGHSGWTAGFTARYVHEFYPGRGTEFYNYMVEKGLL